MSLVASLRQAAASAMGRPAPVVPVELPAPPTTSIEEIGSFAHAVCASCDWRGPGRRARSAARHDGDLHSLSGCGL